MGERKRLAAIERGTTTSDAEAEQPVTMARINGAELLRQMRALADTLTTTAGRLTSAVADLGDTGAAEAEVAAARKAAEKRATVAESAQADAEARAATAEEAAEDMETQLAAAQAEARRRATSWPRPLRRTPPSSSRSALTLKRALTRYRPAPPKQSSEPRSTPTPR